MITLKKKNMKWLLSVLSILAVYAIFLIIDSINDQGEAPVIQFEDSVVEISVKDDLDILLDGVNALDEEDGNLSEEIVIDSLSAFDANQNRTVTYAVFDSDRNVTKASRLIHYVDYTKPKFSLKKSFASNTLNVTNITNMITAYSCVDGDITSRIRAEAKSSSESDVVNFVVHVQDSTGESSSLEIKYNYDTNNYTTNIRLHTYLTYIHVGESFDVRGNISEIETKSVSSAQANNYLNVSSNVDSSTAGVYEVNYTFNYYGDYGFAKCIVVVE